MKNDETDERKGQQDRKGSGQNQPIIQPDGEHKGEAPAGEKGPEDIAQGADPDSRG